jgi:hypothetical protein
MKKEVGLWIDHRQAVIVSHVDQVEETKRVLLSSPIIVHFNGLQVWMW